MPEGLEVSVAIQPIRPDQVSAENAAPWWLARLEVDPAVRPGKFVIKGTRLLADELLVRLQQGSTDHELLRTHPELTPEDIGALHEYAKLPLEMRRCFGAWAEDADELERHLAWSRQQRKLTRQEIDE